MEKLIVVEGNPHMVERFINQIGSHVFCPEKPVMARMRKVEFWLIQLPERAERELEGYIREKINTRSAIFNKGKEVLKLLLALILSPLGFRYKKKAPHYPNVYFNEDLVNVMVLGTKKDQKTKDGKELL